MSEEKKQSIVEELLKTWPIFDHLGFNEFNLGERLQENSELCMKYREQALLEKSNYQKMEIIHDKLKGQLYHHYRFEFDESLQKSEIEQYYIPADPKMVELKKLMLNQKIRVEFFEAAYKALEKQQWAIKSFQEDQRMNS